MKKWWKIRGIVIIEGKMTMETVGFWSLLEFVKILCDWKITGADEIAVHIQRGDGADS